VTTPKTIPTVPINKASVEPGTSVSRNGTKVLLEQGVLKLNGTLPAVALTDANWQPYTFKADGKVKLVSIVPSLDTRVCEQQTHLLGEADGLDRRIERVTVSRDLPAAQKRFALESNLNNIAYYSDYRAGAFGHAAGLLMRDSGLLARAVAVVDGQGKVRYLQVVPDIGNLPDMERAFEVANKLVKGQAR